MSGGKATVENGANLEEIAHQYMHTLSRKDEEVANNMLRDWKLNYVAINGEEHGSVELSIDFDDCIEIPLYDVKKKPKYNRAKTKRDFQKRIDEEWER